MGWGEQGEVFYRYVLVCRGQGLGFWGLCWPSFVALRFTLINIDVRSREKVFPPNVPFSNQSVAKPWLRTTYTTAMFNLSFFMALLFKYFYELHLGRETPPFQKKYSKAIASFSRPHFANTFGCPVLPSYFLLFVYFFSTTPQRCPHGANPWKCYTLDERLPNTD